MSDVSRAILATPWLSELVRQADARRSIKTALSEALPDRIAVDSLTIRLREGGLSIIAPNGAQAARLRQCIPTMIDCLCAQGYSIKHVRVAAGLAKALDAPPMSVERPTLREATVQAIAARAGGLPKNIGDVMTRIAGKLPVSAQWPDRKKQPPMR